jgi:IS30 family transposase
MSEVAFPSAQISRASTAPALGLKRGPLSAAEKDRIAHLFNTMKKPFPAAIARKLNRADSTIEWHMMRNGMRKKPLQVRTKLVYGDGYHAFTAEQDAFIEAKRAEGKGMTYKKIAELATAQFGFVRKWYSVRTRLALLASAAEMED